MTLKNIIIKEMEYNGHKFYALVLITDDKDNPEKIIGTIKKNFVNCISFKKDLK